MSIDHNPMTDQRPNVTFNVTDDVVHAYCRDCSLKPDVLVGQAVRLSHNGPVPWAFNPTDDPDPVFGYIVGYNAELRRLEVAPKR